MKAILVKSFNDPLTLHDVPTPEPGPGQIRTRNHAIGVNFVDMQHSAGHPYPVGLPLIPGIEAAGVVDAIGPDVTLFKQGDRVAFAGHLGAYAEYSVLSEDRLIPLPHAIGFDCAAASLLQGMTAYALVHSATHLQGGDVAVVHGAGSGVGLQLVQTARAVGAVVIASVSTDAKAELARRYGAQHVVVHTRDDLRGEVARITAGAGAHVVFDANGASMVDTDIQLLRATGRLVLYGINDGQTAVFELNRLSGITGSGNRGSLSVTWAAVSDYVSTRADLLAHAHPVLSGRLSGRFRTTIAGVLPLAEAQHAHEMLRARQVAGKLVLVP